MGVRTSPSNANPNYHKNTNYRIPSVKEFDFSDFNFKTPKVEQPGSFPIVGAQPGLPFFQQQNQKEQVQVGSEPANQVESQTSATPAAEALTEQLMKKEAEEKPETPSASGFVAPSNSQEQPQAQPAQVTEPATKTLEYSDFANLLLPEKPTLVPSVREEVEQPENRPPSDPEGGTEKIEQAPQRQETELSDPAPKWVGKPSTRKSITSEKVFRAEAEEQKKRSRAVGSDLGNGSALIGEAVTDNALPYGTLSVGAENILLNYRISPSLTRAFVNKIVQDPEEQAVLDGADVDAATQVLMNNFNQEDITAFVEKYPVLQGADAHVKRIVIHPGRGMKGNRLSFKAMNADNDGDTIIVSMDEAQKPYSKGAYDYMIGTDNDVKFDNDFLQLVKWGDENMTNDILVELFAREGIHGVNPRGLAKAMQKITAPGGVTEAEGLREFALWLRQLGMDANNSFDLDMANQNTGRILMAIDDFNIRIIEAQAVSVDSKYRIPEGEAFDSLGPYPWDADLSVGDVYANLQDAAVALNYPNVPSGTLDKPANIFFRMYAGMAKGIKPDKRFAIGAMKWLNDNERTGDAFEILARHMSAQVSLGDENVGLSTVFRTNILEKAGLPKSYADLPTFFDSFMKEYNWAARPINQARTTFDTAGNVADANPAFIKEIEKTGKLNGVAQFKDTDLTEAFLSIYGDFTLEQLFGKYLPSYWRAVSMDRRLIDVVESGRFAGQENILTKDNPNSRVDQFLRMLMGERTRNVAHFNKKFNEVLNKNAGKAYRAMLHKEEIQVEMATEALYLLGRDVFHHFGMGDVRFFKNTDLGRELIEAPTGDALGGIVYKAFGLYRLSPINTMQEKIDTATDPASGQYLLHKQEEAWRELASISDTWKALVSDHANGGTAINDILLNSKLTKTEKDKKLNDLQKEYGNKMQFDYEIAADIMGNPKGAYGGPRYSTDFGINDLLRTFKQSNSKVDAMANKSLKSASESIAKARKNLGNPNKELNDYLTNLNTNKAEAFVLDRGAYIDALHSIKDATSASSEKASQEWAMNVVYSIMSYKRNGGLYSDLTVADDFYNGSISVNDLAQNQNLISRILRDPDFSIKVYDSFGDAVINREVLTGAKSISELWDWLEENPRFGQALRTQTVVGSREKDGKSYLFATNDLGYSITEINSTVSSPTAESVTNQIFHHLADHPGFGGLVLALTEMTGKKKRQTMIPAEKSLEMLCKQLYSLADKGPAAPFIIDQIVEESLAGVKAEEVDKFRASLTNNLTKYVSELQSLELPNIDMGEIPPMNLLVDENAIASYFHIIQTLSSAKTEANTGINGAESKKKGALAVVFSSAPPSCGVAVPLNGSDGQPGLTPEEFASNRSDYYRMHTFDGQVINEITWDKIQPDPETGRIMIHDPAACTSPGCSCADHMLADPSTNFDPNNQKTPLSRYMTDHRSFDTENLNLKIKKTGDDGKDSISKFDITFDDVDERHNEVHKAYDTGGLQAARRALAQQLYDYHQTTGHDSLSLGDFINVAHTMIREIPTGEEGINRIAITSLSQLNEVVKQGIYDARAKYGELSESDMRTEGMKALLSFNPEARIDPRTLLNKVSLIGQGTNTWYTKDHRRSSETRNLELINKLHASNPDGRATDSQVRARAKQVHKENSKELKAVRDRIGPKLFKGYDILGIVGSKQGAAGGRMIGPKSAWIVSKEAKTEQVHQAALEAQRLGITLIIPTKTDAIERGLISSETIGELTEYPGGVFAIPFFDVLLNGRNTEATNGAVNVGVTRQPKDALVSIVEMPFDNIGLGDAEAQFLEDFTDRVQVKDSGLYEIPGAEAFSLLQASNPNARLKIEGPGKLAKVEIQAAIVNPSDSMGIERAMIDIGEMTEYGDQIYETTQKEVKRYIERFGETDDQGWLPNGRPGEIIGWLRGEVQGTIAWAPIRIYDSREGKASPRTFDVQGYEWDPGRATLVVKWGFNEGLLGNTVKLFEANFASDKFVAKAELPKQMPRRKLKNGMPIDVLISDKSTASRRPGLKIHHSLTTLMAQARVTGNGYNFGDIQGVLPGRDETRVKLQAGLLRIEDWDAALKGGDIEFFPASFGNDKAVMEAFMNKMMRKAVSCGINPSDVLASHYNGVPTDHMFRYEVLFEESSSFQDHFMRLFNFIDPTLCPKDSKTVSDDCLFNENLQMLVPVPMHDGSVKYIWAYVYTGLHFMDKHYSGFSQPSTKSAYRTMPTDNTLMYENRHSSNAEDYMDWLYQDKPSALSSVWLTDETTEME